MSPFVLQKRKNVQPVGDQQLITIREHAFAYNANFIRNNNLEGKEFVLIYINEDAHVVGFKFIENAEDHALSVTLDGGSSRGMGRVTEARSIINDYDWIKNAHKLNPNKFEVRFKKSERMFVINIRPSFEKAASDPMLIPNNTRGIYRYYKDDMVIYIGRGRIRERFQEKGSKSWGVTSIEYSIIDEENDQKIWESFYLKQFEEEFGRLPEQNKVSA